MASSKSICRPAILRPRAADRKAGRVAPATRHCPFTESESSQAQQVDFHVEKLSEIAGISKNQVATLTGQASVGGGWDFVVKAKADGSSMLVYVRFRGASEVEQDQ